MGENRLTQYQVILTPYQHSCLSVLCSSYGNGRVAFPGFTVSFTALKSHVISEEIWKRHNLLLDDGWNVYIHKQIEFDGDQTHGFAVYGELEALSFSSPGLTRLSLFLCLFSLSALFCHHSWHCNLSHLSLKLGKLCEILQSGHKNN